MLAPAITEGLNLVRTVLPEFEPVTLVELKSSMRISSSDHDDYLTRLIGAARAQVENMIQEALVKQTWQQTSNRALKEVKLYISPLLSVTSIEYIASLSDTTNAWLVYDSSSYAVGRSSIIPRSVWPVHRNWQSFRVTYTAGYNDHPTSPTPSDIVVAQTAVPNDLKEAIKELTAHMFENPEGASAVAYETVAKQFGALPGAVKEILNNYIKWGI